MCFPLYSLLPDSSLYHQLRILCPKCGILSLELQGQRGSEPVTSQSLS